MRNDLGTEIQQVRNDLGTEIQQVRSQIQVARAETQAVEHKVDLSAAGSTPGSRN